MNHKFGCRLYLYQMIWIALLPVYLIAYRLLRYLTTPLFRRLGFYRYYSPMLFTVRFNQRLYEIHLGTPWDFFLKRNRAKPSRILGFLAAGLHQLCLAIERGELKADCEFRGMVHYLNRESMSRFGFHLRRPNRLEYVLFSLGYLELCLLTTIAHRKLTLIRLSDLWVINFSAAELMVHKDHYEQLSRKLVPDFYSDSGTPLPHLQKSA